MVWLTILGMAVVTYANRYAFFARGLKHRPSHKFRQFLSYSSYAVLTAIWMPIVFEVDYQKGVSIAGVDYLFAASLAALMSFLRLPSLLIVVLSTAAFFLLRFLILG